MADYSSKYGAFAAPYLPRPKQGHIRRLISSPAAGRGHRLLLLLFYLLLVVHLLRDIWGDTATVLDPPARIALSIVLLSTTCPLFAASSLSLLLSVPRIVVWRWQRDRLPAEQHPSACGRLAAESPVPSLKLANACIGAAAVVLAFSLVIIHLP